MGLDMYLRGKRYLSSFKDEDKAVSEQIGELFPEIKGKRVQEVTIDVGYWRKANAIHQWFVNNVQNGEDECKPHFVAREDLKELLETCEKVLADTALAKELLPPQEGFFFGSTEIDANYWHDIEQTVNILKDALSLDENWDLEYQSSW